MIMARNGRIAPKTGHDHDGPPECRHPKSGYKVHNGLASPLQADRRRYTTAGRHPRRPPMLVQPAARILTRSKAAKFGTHEFLKFLALACNRPGATGLAGTTSPVNLTRRLGGKPSHPADRASL